MNPADSLNTKSTSEVMPKKCRLHKLVGPVLLSPHIFCSLVNTKPKGTMIMDGQVLAKQTLDHIPQPSANAKRIVGLVKEGGRITGYQFSDNSIVAKH